MKSFNYYAPALTLLILAGGLAWTIASRNAQFDQVKTELTRLTDEMSEIQADVQSVQGTLPHVVSCAIDLQGWVPFWRFASLDPDPAELPTGPPPPPSSCSQALTRTTPPASDP